MSNTKRMPSSRRRRDRFVVVSQWGRAALAAALLCAGLVPLSGFAADRIEASAAWPASTGKQPAQDATRASPSLEPRRARFGATSPSEPTRHIADWVVDSGDNQGMPFVIVDKVNARVFVLDADGRLVGDAPALLGLARGDDSVPGIGERKLSTIRPEERTTPAGRFVASLGKNLHGVEILWIDYEAAISMHRVITGNAKERRAQRLKSATVQDRRISYGCINVPVDFYNKVLNPAFTGTNGIVYVLPEIRPAKEFFASYDVEERTPLKTAGRVLPAY